MNNFEKFRDNLQELIDQKFNIAVSKETGEPCNCNGLNCLKCAIYSPCRSCKNAMVEWLLSEYKEPPVDWSKVPVDTPVLVRMDENRDWVRRHFAKYENGIVYTWINGLTSYTVPCERDDNGVVNGIHTGWTYVKLAEEEQKLCSNGKPCTHPNCNRCGTTHFVSECDYGKEQLNEQ